MHFMFYGIKVLLQMYDKNREKEEGNTREKENIDRMLLIISNFHPAVTPLVYTEC